MLTVEYASDLVQSASPSNLDVMYAELVNQWITKKSSSFSTREWAMLDLAV